MSESVSVRRATLGDLSAIVELRIALLREYGDHPLYGRMRSDAPDRARQLFQAQLTSPLEAMFVAEAEDHVVGVLRCVDAASSPLLHPDRYCYVSSAYVRPPYRRQGVLRALLECATDWCHERGLHEMRLHNAPSSPSAGPAWEALGFEVVEHVRRRALVAPTTSRAPEPRVPAKTRSR